MKEPSRRFSALLECARQRPSVAGVFLVGSRAKGIAAEDSDYDCWLIVEDGTSDEAIQELQRRAGDGLDLTVMRTAQFRDFAAWDSPEAWVRYDFAHVLWLLDRVDLALLVDSKHRIPEAEEREVVRVALDAYVNAVFRSVKCFSRNDATGARLEAAASLFPLLDAWFALEGRPRPFAGHLEWELREHPLVAAPWRPGELVKKLLLVFATGDLDTQQEILRETERIFRARGHGSVFDAWQAKDRWAWTWRPR